MTPEQQIEKLEAELARVRAAALGDLQNLQSDVIAKNRRIGQLEAELAKQSDDSPEAADARELLKLWRDVIKKGRKNVDIGLDSDRGRAMIRALKTKGKDSKERVRRAILGCQYDDFAMGRTARQDRAYNDIAKHILRDSDRFEHFEDLYAKHHPNEPQPATPTPPPSPKPAPLTLLPVQPSDHGRRPIYRVLDAIPGEIKTAASPECWMAQCPAHEDRNPSLSIRVVDGMDGELVLLNCFAGCSSDDVVHALGLEMADLFASRLELDHNRPRRERAVPLHLRRAMQQLLDRDERGAA